MTVNNATSSPYSKAFYEFNKGWSHRTVGGVSSSLIELIKPQSIIDVGCGTCTLLAAFRNHAVNNQLGIDGNYVERSILEISQKQFLSFDLSLPLPHGGVVSETA